MRSDLQCIKRPGAKGRGFLPCLAPAVVFAALCLLLAHPSLARGEWKLPDTGITKCYDNSQEIPCPPAGTNNFSGQDAQYNHPDRQHSYTDNGDGTVTDNLTHLVWMKDTADTDGDGSISDDDELNWADAVAYCDDLTFAGSSEWRLPTNHELMRLVDRSTRMPAIDSVFFCEADVYWSGSSYASFSVYAWIVFFDGGFANVGSKGATYYVRCVRVGP